MREQKKEPTPAKGLTRIGNRINGTSNLGKGWNVCKAIQYARTMAYLLQTTQGGLSTYRKVFLALESKFQPFFAAEFREQFYKRLANDHI